MFSFCCRCLGLAFLFRIVKNQHSWRGYSRAMLSPVTSQLLCFSQFVYFKCSEECEHKNPNRINDGTLYFYSKSLEKHNKRCSRQTCYQIAGDNCFLILSLFGYPIPGAISVVNSVTFTQI